LSVAFDLGWGSGRVVGFVARLAVQVAMKVSVFVEDGVVEQVLHLVLENMKVES